MKLNSAKLFIIVLVVCWTSSASADHTHYIYYVAKTIQWGADSQQLVFPKSFEGPADLGPSARVSEAFHRLRTQRGVVYEGSEIQTDRRFASTGAVDVVIGKAAGAQHHVVISEIYWTLIAAGVREVRIPSVKKGAFNAADVPLGAAQIVLQLWQILPPGTPGPGLVLYNNELVRADAIRRRLDDGERSVVNQVIALLQSPVGYVRVQAAIALATIRRRLAKPEGNRVEAGLIGALQDTDVHVRRAVLKAFRGTRSKRTLLALESVVKTDPAPELKAAAVRILTAAGNNKYAVFVLFEKLNDRDDSVVMDAVAKLSKEANKPEVAMALVNVLTHRSTRIAEMALKGIIQLNNREALRKILESDSFSPQYRERAAVVLSAGNTDEADLAFRYLIVHGSEAEQVRSIGAVSKRRRYRLVGIVIGVLDAKSSPSVRVAAAKALGSIKDSKALQPLAAALAKFGDQRAELEQAIIDIFGGLGVDEIIRFSDSDNSVLRRLSIKSLGNIQGGRAPGRVVTVLLGRLDDAEPEIRRSAAYALARIPESRVVARLVKLKKDRDGQIRRQVAYALVRSSHPEADTLLVGFLTDSDPEAKRIAIDGLRTRNTTSAVKKLRNLARAFSRQPPKVRRALAQALVTLSGPSGWDAHKDFYSAWLFDSDALVKVWAIKGIIGKPSDPSVPGLLSALVKDSDESVQIEAIQALGQTNNVEAVDYIASSLFDSSKKVKLVALDALAKLNLERARTPIRDLITNETDKEVRAKAGEVFENLP
jgi:HEAT repeat protein